MEWLGLGNTHTHTKIPLVRSVIVVSQVCFMYYLNLGSFFSSMEKKVFLEITEVHKYRPVSSVGGTVRLPCHGRGKLSPVDIWLPFPLHQTQTGPQKPGTVLETWEISAQQKHIPSRWKLLLFEPPQILDRNQHREDALNTLFVKTGICNESLFLSAFPPDQGLLLLTLLDLIALFFPQKLVLKSVGVVQWAGGSEILKRKIRTRRSP